MTRFWLGIALLLGMLLVACGGAGDDAGESVAVAEGNDPASERAESETAQAAPTSNAAAEAEAEAADDAVEQGEAADADHPERVISTIASDAAPPSEVPDRPAGASGFTHFVFQRLGDQVVTTLVEGPRGGQVREPISFPALQELAQSDLAVPPELQMTRTELGTLVEQLKAVREGALRYSDVSIALADGYEQVTDVVPNMGAHFLNRERTEDGVLNFAEPEILIYKGGDEEAWELVGTSFVLPYQLVGEVHPDGFAGPLDLWHMHYSLCTGSAINSRAAREVDCEAGGGTFIPQMGWMIHAWVVDDNPMGVFSMWNPNVPPTLTTTEIRESRDQATFQHSHADGSFHVHAADAPADAIVVNIENFHHATLEIVQGQTVIWVNSDGVPHTITAGRGGASNGGFDSLIVGGGQTYRHLFDVVGEFEFTCLLHPQMNGTIIVVSRAT